MVPRSAQPVVGLPVSTPAPSFELPLASGETMTLKTLRAFGKPVLLLFSDPNCGPCKALLPDISRWQQQYAERLTLAVISRGSLEANQVKAVEFVLVQQDHEVAQVYQANGTPSAVLVQPDGTIGSSLAMGADAIKALVARLTEMPSLLSTSKIGELAPAISLPDLNGNSINLATLQGRDTLLLFWNPSCGYCNQMLADLRAWDCKPSEERFQLLVVSTGTVEANQAMNLRSPVVLDESFSTARAFGATGTPSAVLIDGDGKIVSQVAVGVPTVLALMGVSLGQSGQVDELLAVK